MCYDYHEVKYMDNERTDSQIPTEEEFSVKDTYTPRPKWQVYAAWFGLAVFAVLMVLLFALMFKG